MKKIPFSLIIITFGLIGCSATTVAPPQEKAISGKPFEITVPKNLIGTDKSLVTIQRISPQNNKNIS